MSTLQTTEKYILAQLLACGAVSKTEFENATEFSRTVREDRIESLREKDILQQTLYKD